MSDSTFKETANFLITKEYKKFAEFCDACKEYKYIGLCYGPPGVGKTLSARHYSYWDNIEKVFGRYDDVLDIECTKNFYKGRTIYYTAPVLGSPGRVEKEIHKTMDFVGWIYAKNKEKLDIDEPDRYENGELILDSERVKLVIVDEADRLKTAGLEQIRDIYDRYRIGVILIGMPGIEKRLARYPQLYSRVGFVHNYKTISNEEMEHILSTKWTELGMTFNIQDFTDKEALSEIIRITRGNFRLLTRLFTQIDRVMKINNLNVLTKEVVEVARENLIIGSI